LKEPEPSQLASARVALRPLIECSHCFMASRETTEYKGEALCPKCLAEAQQKPTAKPQIPVVEKPVPTIIKPTNKWEQRVAHMQVGVSKMESELLEALHNKDIHVEAQKEYCIKKVVVDFVYKNLAFFIDGEDVHIKREEKDEENRQRLATTYGLRVIPLSYKSYSNLEKERLLSMILEIIKHDQKM